jgi:hypothetical protein
MIMLAGLIAAAIVVKLTAWLDKSLISATAKTLIIMTASLVLAIIVIFLIKEI